MYVCVCALYLNMLYYMYVDDLVVLHGNLPAQCRNIIGHSENIMVSQTNCASFCSMAEGSYSSPPTTGNPSFGEVMSCSPSASNLQVSVFRPQKPVPKPWPKLWPKPSRNVFGVLGYVCFFIGCCVPSTTSRHG